MDAQIKMTNVELIKILLVDDKPENHTALESIFQSDPYSFSRANSGKEALKILLNEDDFALILMDVKMPDMSGFETASMIYKRKKLEHIPIIFITSNDSDEENLFKGYLSGGVDYIVKPINPELLKIKVHVFVELFKKNRQLLVQKEKLDLINNDLKKQIKERVNIEEELRFKNIQLSDAQKLTHIGSWDWNLLTNKITCSNEIYEIYDINRSYKEFDIEKIFENIHPGDLDYVQTNIANSISIKNSFDIYFRYISPKGKIKYINKKGRTITNERNEVVKVFGTSQDITDLKKTEEQLKIFNLFEKMLDEIYIFSEKDLKFLYANAEALRNVKCSLNNIKRMSLFNIMQNYETKSFDEIILPLLDGTKEKIVFFGSFKRTDNSSYPVEIHLQLIKQNEKWESIPSLSENVFLAVVIDLTERRRKEQELAASLKEKELLIKEIHHRVKNNLQVISSLLNIQKSYIDNEKINSIIDESRDRIRSMAILHEKLYQSKDLSQIDFNTYIHDLASGLLKSYSDPSKEIVLEISSKADSINIDLGISIGLILNEFISNCIKHAFTDVNKGKISISFKESDDDTFCLSVKDNGKGLPKGFKIEDAESLGLKLVNALVEQIKGNLTLRNDTGTEFEIIFPAAEAVIHE
jgi:two-component sensor histidine kinase/DNA-binding response OmpR family regulator